MNQNEIRRNLFNFGHSKTCIFENLLAFSQKIVECVQAGSGL